MRIITCGRKVRGTCHADDLSYLFYNAGAKKLKHRTAEYTTIRRMVTILVKFAECGDPNIPLTDAVCWPSSNGSTSNANNGNYKQTHQHQPENTEKDTRHSDKVANGTSANDEKQSNDEEQDVRHHACDENEKTPPKNADVVHICCDNDESSTNDSVKNDGQTNLLLQQEQPNSQQQQQKQHHNHHQVQHQYWPPITCCDDTTTFKCLNISDELEVIDLPEAEKLKLWDSMYEDKSLLY